jgi:hypothetical protein
MPWQIGSKISVRPSLNEQTEDATGRRRRGKHVGTGTSAPRHKTRI